MRVGRQQVHGSCPLASARRRPLNHGSGPPGRREPREAPSRGGQAAPLPTPPGSAAERRGRPPPARRASSNRAAPLRAGWDGRAETGGGRGRQGPGCPARSPRGSRRRICAGWRRLGARGVSSGRGCCGRAPRRPGAAARACPAPPGRLR